VEPPQPPAVRARPASSSALSTMNENNSSSSPSHLSVLAKVLRLFRSHSDSSMPRPPSPPRRRAAGAVPPRSSSSSPCTISSQQQVGRFRTYARPATHSINQSISLCAVTSSECKIVIFQHSFCSKQHSRHVAAALSAALESYRANKKV